MNKQTLYQTIIFLGNISNGLLALYYLSDKGYYNLVFIFWAVWIGPSLDVLWNWNHWWARHITTKHEQFEKKYPRLARYEKWHEARFNS